MLNQDSIYGSKFIPEHSNITGDRHPHSILQFPNDFEYQNNSDYEMVYVFKEKQGTYNPQKTAGKPYKIQEGNITDGHVYDKNKKRGSINNKGDRHPTSILQFPNDFEYQNNSDHEMVYVFKEKQGTYNPQKTEGEPYTRGLISNIGCYGETGESKTYFAENKTGDRHPTTILKFNNPKKSLHRTQKPIDLCEWLIKTYSNEGDNVLDFTMGSGTTGVACINTNRNFIGVEMDEKIFKVARHRLFKHELEKFKSTVYT
jgi:DNA modification methylase